MNRDSQGWITRPRSDERAFWDLVMGIYASQTMLVAHDLGLFPLLAKRALSLPELCQALKIGSRPAGALLSVGLAAGLLRLRDGRYELTPLSEDYLLPDSPTYFGGFFDNTIANHAVFSFDKFKEAVRTDRSQVYGGDDLYRSYEEQAGRAPVFTAMMHSHSMAAALAWPDKIDLADHRVMLDVGGGSGAHSIGAVRRWPGLRSVLVDLQPVCVAALGYISQYGLQDRIRTQAGNIWTDSFPTADLHFYADIYHDFSPEKCLFLTRKSFESLVAGGRIVIHEMLFNEDKAGPLAVAGYNTSMLLWTEGQQFSGPELKALLAEAGFVDVEVMPTFGYWSVVSGRKPG